MLTSDELANLKNGEYFKKKLKIGSGAFGSVYSINDRYVVKKVSQSWLTIFDMPILNFKSPHTQFRNELIVTNLLSKQGISPRVLYYSENRYWYYVMERLDETLYSLIKNKRLTLHQIDKLEQIFLKLINTTYRHDDMHQKNIMWSEKLDDFRIIDWGLFSRSKKKKRLNNYDTKFIKYLKEKVV